MKDESGYTGNTPGATAEEGATTRWWHKIKEPAFLEPVFCLFEHPQEHFGPYVHEGQMVVDLGCGWGHYSFLLAAEVGPTGKVYAIDLLDRCIRRIQKKARKRGIANIEAVTASALDIGFIQDHSVDFLLANGLLCSMTGSRRAAVSEIERVLSPDGAAFLSLGAPPPMGLVNEAEWNAILDRFTVVAGGPFKDLWAIVKTKPAVS